MSVEKITAVRYKCKCNHRECAHRWTADEIPDRCARCKKYTWNRAAHKGGVSPQNFTAFGKSQSLSVWGREYKIKPGTIYQRLERGWTIEDAIRFPARKRTLSMIANPQEAQS